MSHAPPELLAIAEPKPAETTAFRPLTDEQRERLAFAAKTLRECVEITRDKRGGIPVIRGSRFTVAQVLAEIADGRSVGELCRRYLLDEAKVVNFLQGIAVQWDMPGGIARCLELPVDLHGTVIREGGTT